MLAHCILYLLDSLHQDNYLVLHSTSPVIPLGKQWMVIYASSLYFPRVWSRNPRVYLKTSSKICDQLCDYFLNWVHDNFFENPMFAFLSHVLDSPWEICAWPSWRGSPWFVHNFYLFLEINPSLRSQTTKFVLRLSLWWVILLNPHQTCAQTNFPISASPTPLFYL